MYPIISIGTHVIEMTGIAILTGIVTFLLSAHILVRKSRLQFIKLFYWLPLPLIGSYILGSYFAFMATETMRIPTNINQIYHIISPFGYDFHVMGIIIAITGSLWIFLKKMPSRHERRMWINIIASSITLSLIPLGIGLLLWDTLIWLPTDGARWIETFRPDVSNRSAYGKVYPVGLFLAAAGLITFIMQRIGEKPQQPSGQGYFTLTILTLLIGYVRTFVNTPKYLVLQILNTRVDTTTYVCVAIATLLLQQYIIEQHRVSLIKKNQS